MVRLSKVVVRPEYLEEYKAAAAEVGAVSLRTEPGVLTMYAVAEKNDPCRITILETYADTAAYRSHIASAHFRKYAFQVVISSRGIRFSVISITFRKMILFPSVLYEQQSMPCGVWIEMPLGQ